MPADVAPVPQPVQPDPEPGEPRILVVEDDPIGQRVAVQLVARLGYAVDIAADGQAAIDAVAAAAYALVLMDCQMPGVDGYMATAEIRRREAALGERCTAGADRRADGVPGGRRPGPLPGGRHGRVPDEADRRPAARGADRALGAWARGRPALAAEALTDEAPGPGRRRRAGGRVPPIVDPAGLLGASGALSPQHREIVELFLEEVPRRLAMLGTAAARGDRDQVARLAHTLAGSADSLGASRLAAACARLEGLVRGQAQAPGGLPMAEAIGAVHQELEQLQAALPGVRPSPEREAGSAVPSRRTRRSG